MNRIEKIKAFLEKSPNDAFLTHALALEWLKENNIENAIECFETNHSNHPDYVATYYHLAKAYEEQLNSSKAIELYEEGIEVAQKIGDNHSLRELRSALDNLL